MKTNDSLQISELFYSIQGESSYAGFPCLFIRLAGCNLRCTYCDAKYTYEEAGRQMSLQEVLDFVNESPVRLVEITGGEPLLQEQVYPLMEALLDDDRTVLLETNGSIGLEKVPAGVVKIMDIKCPGSGMDDMNHLANIKQLAGKDEVKFVLRSRQDYQWAVDCIRKHMTYAFDSLAKGPKILFSPVTNDLNPAELAAWILEDTLPIRLQIQLHTVLWPAKSRGV
ncbi:MAG: radical SAM protein [Thermodesulfobacteriota bacterium]